MVQRSAPPMKPRHSKRFEHMVTDHVPVLIRWYVVDCKCGWQSPLCTSRDKAQKLYDRHCGREKRLGPDV